MPDEVSSIDDIAIDKDGILDALNSPDEKDEDIDLGGKEAPEGEEVIPDNGADDDADDEGEEKEELEIDEEKEEDELSYSEVPKRQEILKAYPDFEKKFPGVMKAVYREQQYAETFPTIVEAKEAANQLGMFHELENDLLGGNIEKLLTSVKRSNEEAFGQITGSLLQTLEKVDRTAYLGTLNHIVSNALFTAFKSGESSKDEQLQIAAQLLNKFIYGTTDIVPSRQIQKDPGITAKEVELNQQREMFANDQLSRAVDNITTRVDNMIKSTIDKHIDPKGVMTSYVKSKAVEDALKLAKDGVSTDPRFRGVLNQLWKDSAKNHYNEASLLKIRNAIISRAKTLLPSVIQSVKASALKGSTIRTRTEKEDKPIRSSSQAATRNSSSKKDIPRGMSTLDYLNQD